MSESIFHFKQFSIKQDACAMKVGTDGVLLGAWTNTQDTSLILDVGCGTGLIALMLAQKCQAQIDAIDIDEAAVNQAKSNIDKSKWKNRINVYQNSLQKQATDTVLKYDLITCNPPFFQNALKPENEARAKARHSSLLPFHDLVSSSFYLLNDSGRLSLIIPWSDANHFIKLAENIGFYTKQLCKVYPKPNKNAKRVLIELSKIRVDKIVKQDLIVENEQRHDYTSAYISLTKDYYLKF